MNADPTVWTARWIEPVEPEGLRRVQRPIYHLVGSFETQPGSEATLRITARGLYEVFVNGARVGDRELTPGFTAYRHRLQVQTYDIAPLLRSGENVVGVALSDGWWRGQNTVARRTDSYGPTTAVLAEVRIDNEVVAATDGSWIFNPSHVSAADLVAGEAHDMRRRRDDWCLPGADRSDWEPVRVADHPFYTLCETVGPPVRRAQEIPAISVDRVGNDRHLVDFGQVSNGWIRLSDLGPKDTRLTIVHGEALTPDGKDVDIAGQAAAAFDNDPRWEPVFQTDVVISAGDGSVFEPRHSTKGFRYVRIDGHPGPLNPESISSIVVHSEVEPVGGFTSDNDDLNWLHRAADWSLRTNLCDIPTDCPTRERAGWTGDWQIYIDTASYLYDVEEFTVKWLLDVAAEQLESGAILHFVPDPADHTDPRVAWWTNMQGSAGWGDAIVHVPWELYRATGRTDVAEKVFDAMCRWVDFAAERAATGRHPQRIEQRPTPDPHEKYLWDTGFHFGEWNEPGHSLEEEVEASGLPSAAEMMAAKDHGPTATAFLYRSATELSELAELLGEAEASERYAELAENVRSAWQTEFLDADGRVVPSTQPNLVRALAFDLLPEELHQPVADQLAELVRANDTHLATGFLATPFLLPVLADHGHLDVAYDLLFQRTPPSWLHMRDQGATTIWESWVPFNDDGSLAASLNHFSMGAVVGFLHRYVAGLDIIEPGYRRFRVEPRPGPGVSEASTHHRCPHGLIEVAWAGDPTSGRIEVTVPAGTTAELAMPGQPTEVLGAGTYQRRW